MKETGASLVEGAPVFLIKAVVISSSTRFRRGGVIPGLFGL